MSALLPVTIIMVTGLTVTGLTNWQEWYNFEGISSFIITHFEYSVTFLQALTNQRPVLSVSVSLLERNE